MRIRIGIQPKMLDPDPYQMNTVQIRNPAVYTKAGLLEPDPSVSVLF